MVLESPLICQLSLISFTPILFPNHQLLLQVREPETQREEVPPPGQVLAAGRSRIQGQAGLLGVTEKPKVCQELKVAFAKGFEASYLHGECAH